MATNTIGAHSFKHFSGVPRRIQQEIERIARAGVDGEAFRKHGARGEPFDIVATIDYATGGAALTAMDTYAGLVGEDPQAFVWDSYAEDPLKVIVLGVEILRVMTMAGILGGLNVATGGTGVVLEIRFTLCLVTVPEP